MAAEVAGWLAGWFTFWPLTFGIPAQGFQSCFTNVQKIIIWRPSGPKPFRSALSPQSSIPESLQSFILQTLNPLRERFTTLGNSPLTPKCPNPKKPTKKHRYQCCGAFARVVCHPPAVTCPQCLKGVRGEPLPLSLSRAPSHPPLIEGLMPLSLTLSCPSHCPSHSPSH